MSKPAVATPQKENESLRCKIAAIKQNLVELQRLLQRNEAPAVMAATQQLTQSLHLPGILLPVVWWPEQILTECQKRTR